MKKRTNARLQRQQQKRAHYTAQRQEKKRLPVGQSRYMDLDKRFRVTIQGLSP